MCFNCLRAAFYLRRLRDLSKSYRQKFDYLSNAVKLSARICCMPITFYSPLFIRIDAQDISRKEIARVLDLAMEPDPG